MQVASVLGSVRATNNAVSEDVEEERRFCLGRLVNRPSCGVIDARVSVLCVCCVSFSEVVAVFVAYRTHRR